MSGELILTDRAALELVNQAEAALAQATSPDDADELWRKIKAVEEAARLARVSEVAVLGLRRVQLRAKRRYGELLPAPEPKPGPGRGHKTRDTASQVSDADRQSASRARKLAAVPVATFEATLAAESIEQVSEAAILRADKREQRPAPPPAEPATGTYPVLYADPPWRYEHNETPDLRAVENHYPTMTVEEIAALDVPAADDAVLFLWATNPKLREALAVMDAWGFGYRTNACWVKDRFGMGYYVRGQHELLLIGRRGNPGVPEPGDRPSSVIEAHRREHSGKPEAVYELIERMYPDASRVELFARESRSGWEPWGNQIARPA